MLSIFVLFNNTKVGKPISEKVAQSLIVVSKMRIYPLKSGFYYPPKNPTFALQ